MATSRLPIAEYSRGLRVARLAAPGHTSGMTLLELLVVIGILAILLGAAIPVISPANDTRRLREAARGVNTFIAGAKTRARETGRLSGVAFKRLSQDTGRAEDNGVCVEMYYVEQMPPYAGFDSNARVIIGTDQNGAEQADLRQVVLSFVRYGDDVPQSEDGLPPGLDSDEIPAGFIRPGDGFKVSILPFIEITDTADEGQQLDNGYYRPGYGKPANSLFGTIREGSINSLSFVYDPFGDRLDASSDLNQYAQGDGGIRGNRFWTEPLPYKILRQPTRASSEPFQLPNKAAIDLEASGFGNGLRLHDPYAIVTDTNRPESWNSGEPAGPNNASDIIVMFSPEGTIQQSYLNLGPRSDDGVDSDDQSGDTDDLITRTAVSSDLFLLVGLRENQPAPQTDFGSFSGTEAELQSAKSEINWLNGDSRWVVVGAQTGSLTTAENAFVDPRQYAQGTMDNAELSRRRGLEVRAAREFARQSVGMGGR